MLHLNATGHGCPPQSTSLRAVGPGKSKAGGPKTELSRACGKWAKQAHGELPSYAAYIRTSQNGQSSKQCWCSPRPLNRDWVAGNRRGRVEGEGHGARYRAHKTRTRVG